MEGNKHYYKSLIRLWKVYRKPVFQAFSKIADFTYPLTIQRKVAFIVIVVGRCQALPTLLSVHFRSPRMGRNFFTCRLRFMGLTVENTHRPLPYMFGIDHKKSKPASEVFIVCGSFLKTTFDNHLMMGEAYRMRSYR
jgi:hypothetical protein